MKQKSFVVERKVNDADIQKPALLDAFVALTQDVMPLLNFCSVTTSAKKSRRFANRTMANPADKTGFQGAPRR